MSVFHGVGVVFIMSHSFTRSEKAGVWESLRPFSGALPCSLMDFIGPKGEGRNPVYLNAQLCGSLNAALSSFLSHCASIRCKNTKTFDPFCLLHLLLHSIAIFVLHRFLNLNIFPVKWGCLSLGLPLAFLAAPLCHSGGNLHLKTSFCCDVPMGMLAQVTLA